MTTLDAKAIIAGLDDAERWLTQFDKRGVGDVMATVAKARAALESLPPQPVEVTEAARAVLRAYDEWSGAEPSTSALERAIDRDLRAAVDAILEARITATRPSGDGIRAGRAEVIDIATIEATARKINPGRSEDHIKSVALDALSIYRALNGGKNG